MLVGTLIVMVGVLALAYLASFAAWRLGKPKKAKARTS